MYTKSTEKIDYQLDLDDIGGYKHTTEFDDARIPVPDLFFNYLLMLILHPQILPNISLMKHDNGIRI